MINLISIVQGCKWDVILSKIPNQITTVFGRIKCSVSINITMSYRCPVENKLHSTHIMNEDRGATRHKEKDPVRLVIDNKAETSLKTRSTTRDETMGKRGGWWHRRKFNIALLPCLEVEQQARATRGRTTQTKMGSCGLWEEWGG